MFRAVLVLAMLATPAQAASLPEGMRGIWGYEPRACTVASDDGRVEIGPDFVYFFASYCSVESHRRLGDGTLVTRGQCRGEGEETVEPGSIRLRLVARDRLFIAQDGGEGHVFQRCERPIPVR